MARFAKLVDGREEVDHIGEAHHIRQASIDTNSLPLLISTALLDDFPGQTEENNVPFTSNLSPISSSRSSSSHLQQPDDSVDWWQMVCSDDLLANGLPDVPAVPCRRRKPTRRKLAGQNAENGARPNPCWEDIANLRKIKSTHHKLSVLRRDAPPIGLNGTINDYDSEADEIVHADQDVGKAMTVDFKQRALKRVEVSNGDSITALSGRTTLQTFCSTILEHVGFDGEDRPIIPRSNLLS